MPEAKNTGGPGPAPQGSFRARLQAREPMLAAFVPAPSPELIEVAAYSGFDFAVIDAEHGPITPGDIVHMVRAAQSARMPVMVRVPFAGKDFVLRSLDAGADGILVPQVDTADMAREAVAETHYPPIGRRGGAYYARAHRFTKDMGWEFLERANQQIVTGVMIESRAGVANAEAISKVLGVDFLLFGSTDLAINIGKGAHNAPEVEASVARVLATTHALGMAAGISAATAAVAKQYTELGFQIVVTGLLPLLIKEASRFTQEARFK